MRHMRVAIIGVDGTGKSSTINNLKRYYGDKAVTKYMGFRDFETHLAQKWINRENRCIIPKLKSIMYFVAAYLEMWHRYNEVKPMKKSLVIFDRYVWETKDNSQSIAAKSLAFILFNVLFPKPDAIVYLYCPIKLSLKRKDDIKDPEEFAKMKERVDKIYINQKNTFVIDTSKNGEKEVCGQIIEHICFMSNAKIL